MTTPSPDSPLPTALYLTQEAGWPQVGRHILAHADADSIIVYQAYRPAIGDWALAHGHLGGPDFSFQRMSWIKPNFLWMMYRCGWATKAGQERVLGLRVRRSFFDHLLTVAVASTHAEAAPLSHVEWKAAVACSEVRLQWDPDHAPNGSSLARRAVQLGLRGAMLRRLAEQDLLEVLDMTPFVQQQRAATQPPFSTLWTPVERVYPLSL